MNAEATRRYVAEFSRIEPELAGAQVSWLRAARRRALKRFDEAGFPSLRDENWRYTPLKPIENRGFRIAGPSSRVLKDAALAGLQFQGLSCHELVFVNGYYADSWSTLGRLPAGGQGRKLGGGQGGGGGGLGGHISPHIQ